MTATVFMPRASSRAVTWSDHAWRPYVGLLGLLVVGYFAVPSAAAATWLYLTAGASTATALYAGALVHAPEQRRPWLYLAHGTALFTVGDVIWAYYDLARGADAPFPSMADALYLFGMAMLLRGVQLLVRARRRERDVGTVLDAAMLTCSVAICTWVLVVAPVVSDNSLSLAAAVVSLAYPLGDLALIFLCLRLLGSRSERSTAFTAMVVGVAALLLTDIGYALLLATDSYATGHPLDAGWLLSYAAFGLAALHPSMRRVAMVQRVQARALSRRRLVAYAALAIGPALSVVASDEPGTRAVSVAGALVFFTLVLARLSLVVVDLEQRVRREAEVRAAAEEGERVARDLRLTQRRFATMAAHELRTPLTGLIGSLSTLARIDGDRSGLANELTDISLRQASRLARLSEDLLVVASTERDDLVVTSETVDVAQAVDEALNALDGGAPVRVAGVAGLMVQGDALRLTQVLTNLVRNGIQHACPGTFVSVRAETTQAEVVLHVHNSGDPIDPERIPALFTTFGHGDAARVGGLGVGLWIVHRLVSAMGGSVGVRSTEATGTTFSVTLRRA